MTTKPKAVNVTPESKIVVLKKENPFRESTAVHKRAQAVLLSGGKTVEAALKKGARTSTVRALVREGLVRLVTSKTRSAA